MRPTLPARVTVGLCALLMLALLPPPGLADTFNIRWESSVFDTWYDCDDTALDGHLLYVATGETGLRVLDVSDPAQPAEIGRGKRNQWADWVSVSGEHVYVTDESDFVYIYDVTDPTAPNHIGTLPIADLDGQRFHAGDGFGVLGREYAYYEVFDLSDPGNPVSVSTLDYMASGRDPVAMQGSTVIIRDMDEGYPVFDLSDPGDPDGIGLIPVWSSGASTTMQLVGDIFIVTLEIAYEDDWLRAYDISDPADPQLLSSQLMPEWRFSAVESDVLYGYRATGDGSILYAHDLSDPTSLTLLSQTGLTSVGGYSGQVVDGVLLHEAYNTGLGIVDVSDPAHPTEQTPYTRVGSIEDVAAQGNQLWCYWDSGRVTGHDVSDPAAVVTIADFTLDNSGTYGSIGIHDDLLLASEHHTVILVDVSDPASPEVVGEFSTYNHGGYGDHEFHVHEVGGDRWLTLLSHSSCRIITYDITDPANVSLVVSAFDAGAGRFDHATWRDDDIVFMKSSQKELLITDVSDLLNPVSLSHTWLFPNSWYYQPFIILDDELFTFDGERMLIVDLNDLTAPERFAHLDLFDSDETLYLQMQQQDGFVVMTRQRRQSPATAEVYDVSNPYGWEKTGELPLTSHVDFFCPIGDDVVVVSDGQMLEFLRYSDALFLPDLDVDIVRLEPVMGLRGTHTELPVRMANHTDAPVTVDLWTEVVLPGGEVTDPLYILEDFPLAAGATFDSTAYTREVPWNTPEETYIYRLCAGQFPDQIEASDELVVNLTPWTGVGEDAENGGLPREFALGAPRPNPFNPTTTLDLSMPVFGEIDVVLYNLHGQRVSRLANGSFRAGEHTILVDGSRLAAGIYIARATGPEGALATQKLVLVK